MSKRCPECLGSRDGHLSDCPRAVWPPPDHRLPADHKGLCVWFPGDGESATLVWSEVFEETRPVRLVWVGCPEIGPPLLRLMEFPTPALLTLDAWREYGRAHFVDMPRLFVDSRLALWLATRVRSR